MSSISRESYSDLKLYYGDLHNHCAVSYGHGPLEAALRNARLQLDFASVTVHGAWPDLPAEDPALDYLVDYHQQGFEQARRLWPGYLAAMERANRDGEFVTFPSFEWHSCEYGDHCVYFKNGAEHQIYADANLPSLRRTLQALESPTLLIPHHIGYRQGYRGINWETYSEALSPVVETFSFHGLSESSEGPYPYLHSMGPRHQLSTAQSGWAQGHVFGVVGSTDHHNAFPGSHGYGRLGVWAKSLTREDVWDAVQQRRTYALTGDRIAVEFSLNGHVTGALAPPMHERLIDVDVCGGSSIDYVELIHNNDTVHRESVYPIRRTQGAFKVHIELGWGELDVPTPWDVDLEICKGVLLDVEPRFRGYGPTDSPDETAVFDSARLLRPAPNRVSFQVQTRRNPSLHTSATEGISVEVEGDTETILVLRFNGQRHELALSDLFGGSRTFYLGGFVSPAVCVHRAIPREEYSYRLAFKHNGTLAGRDWYYVRVRQRNDQWAWSSPIWVGEPTTP